MVSEPFPTAWFRQTDEGALIFVRVTPNAGRDRIEAPVALADGTVVLRVRVSAQPEDGRANAAVIALIAKATRLPRSALSVKSGATARTKTLVLTASPDTARAAQQTISALFQ